MPIEEAKEILRDGKSGVLALVGDDGYPYTVPMCYYFDGGKIYFHSAATGHKMDAIENCDKASFCVVSEDRNIPEKLTTAYKSVVVFGKIAVIEEPGEKRTAIEALGKKYSPGYDAEMNRQIDRDFRFLRVIALTPEHITGKEAMEFTKNR